MSSGLTEDQKRKIEENRRKALAKRAERLGHAVPPATANTTGVIQSRKQCILYKELTTETSQFGSGSNRDVDGGASSLRTVPNSNTHCVDVIEQNRQRALAKRAIRLNQTPQKNNVSEAPSCSTIKAETVQNSHSANDQSRLREPTNHTNDFNQKSSQSKNSSNFFSSASTSNRSSDTVSISSRSTATTAEAEGSLDSGTCQAANQPAWNAFSGVGSNPVKGSCMLIARDRFEVNVGYCIPLVHLFRTMDTKLYDAVSKRWTFRLSEYNKFMRAVEKLKPAVDVQPLPKALLQAFAGLVRGEDAVRNIPMADLSKVEPSLVNSLMSFQRDGVNFGVYKNGRVLIADDMGLGKTIQAICLTCYYREEWPLLVVVPSSVRFDWAQQFRRWVPSLDSQTINVVVSGKESCTSGLINIVSYDLMSRQADQLKRKHFQIVIMDECHLLKNHKTARCKAAMPLMQNARRVILLSGTPALSRPSELYTQISAICPFMFKYHDFGVRYCNGKKFPWGWDYSGSSNMTELQLLLEEKIMIRRLKSDVLSELPDKVRQMVLLDPNTIRINKELKSASSVFSQGKFKRKEQRGLLLDFFHKSGAAKLKAVKSYVADLLEEESKKFIIFAHHADILDGIEDTVKAKVGSNYMRIDGSTNSEQRNFFCKKFQHNDDIRTAILSITAANAGLDLSAANLVVFAELFWNPGILVQAEDRAHRIGQQDCVNVQYLVATGTSDDTIWPMIQEKLDVLSKAGLTKDNFSSAETTQFLDPEQKQITKFLEESFAEDLFVGEMDDADADKKRTSGTETASLSPVEQSIKSETTGSSPVKQSIKSENTGSSPVEQSIKSETTGSSPVKQSIKSETTGSSPVKQSIKSETTGSSPVKPVFKQQSILKYVSPVKNKENLFRDTHTLPQEKKPSGLRKYFSAENNTSTEDSVNNTDIITDTNSNHVSPVPCSKPADCDDDLEAFLMDSDDDFGAIEQEPLVKKRKVPFKPPYLSE